jgi:hypothetical protein
MVNDDFGRLTGSREPDPSCAGSGPSGFDPGRAAQELYDAARVCLVAERQRRARLKPNAPASTYTARRIAQIEAALAKAEGTAA